MRRLLTVVCRGLVALVLLGMATPAVASASAGDPVAGETRRLHEALGALRVPFVANQGQVDARVAYYAPTFAGTLFVTRQGQLVYSLPGGKSAEPRFRLTETFRQGTARPAGGEPGRTKVSSFIGNDSKRWREAVPTYEHLGLGDVWPGVSVALHARGRNVEKVFTVAPGASVDRIRVRVGGARGLRVRPDGALVARTGRGDVTFTPPVAYQDHAGERRTVPVAYRLRGHEYRFAVGSYDRTRPLVIDPLLQSTYLGGSGVELAAVAVAIHPTSGDVYVAGTTDSTNFPEATGGAQGAMGGGSQDAFVARLDSTLTSLAQATYLGGSGLDRILALAVDPASGDVYVAGKTGSTNFPGTAGSAQVNSGGDTDGFVARLNAPLTSLIRATYLGGDGIDQATALAIHPTSGEVYVGGMTDSANLASTAGGAQDTFGGSQDAFIARLTPSLGSLIQTTYLGGSGTDNLFALAIDPVSGDVLVGGSTLSTDFPSTAGSAQPDGGPDGQANGFVARLNAALTSLTRATYLGGSAPDLVFALAVHPISGDVYAAGQTPSADFPGTAGGAQDTLGGNQDAFVARLNAALTSLIRATYLGGGGDETALALAIHPTSGDVYVAGTTDSTFPGTTNGAQQNPGGGTDVFLVRLNAALTSLTQATYLGGGGNEDTAALAIDPTSGDVYVAGLTESTDFPHTAGGAQAAMSGPTDAFVARLTADLAATWPDLTVTKVHGGDFAQGQTGAVYLVTVTNVGSAPSAGTVTVTDTPPAGLTVTALAGTGWTCTLATRSCTRADALTAGASYPSILVTVTVAVNAGSPLVNTVTVAGGSDVTPANNTDTDPTTIVAAPNLAIGKTHVGNFGPGQVGATYTVTVTNMGSASTVGTVTVTDTLPGGLTATALAGTGWSCALATMTCTRADALAGGASYAAITVTVDVSAAAPPSVTNTATVSGGGDVNPANDTAADVTTISARFVDVPGTDPLFSWIEALVAAGLTGGCGTAPLMFCPDAGVSRGQIAVFLLRGIHGAGFSPPPATGVFVDVPLGHPFVRWIEQLASEDITSGCATGPARYCPDAGVTRGQMAVLLLRAKHGADFDPPAATGLFTDVPLAHPFVRWIEQLALEGITGGCGPTTFCPDAITTREQMAVFLVRTFNLPI